MVARVWCGGEKEKMAILVLCEFFEEFEAELFALAGGGAGVRLVHHHALGSHRKKMVPVAFALDVVEADHHERVLVEKPRAIGQVTLDTAGAGGSEGHGADMEAVLQFGLPLLDKMRRTQDGASGDFPSVEEFANDEPGFYGFSYSHIVGDKESHNRQAECHEQRHELVGPRLDGNVSKRTERACPVSEFQQDGVSKQSG